MKTVTIEIEEKVDELLAVLDMDIQHIQDTLSNLDQMRSMIVKRDDISLQKLLETVQSKSNHYGQNELKRKSLREQLAIVSDCSLEQMTLSRLEGELTGQKKDQVAEKRTQLQTLALKLKHEYLSTTMLLSDCARFNSSLLRSVLEVGQAGAVTYSPNGSAQRQTNSAFMNVKF